MKIYFPTGAMVLRLKKFYENYFKAPAAVKNHGSIFEPKKEPPANLVGCILGTV